MPIDYISDRPCPECGQYRHKSQMHVGRRRCDDCEQAYWGKFYQPEMDAKIREQEAEAQYARMTESGIILLDN